MDEGGPKTAEWASKPLGGLRAQTIIPILIGLALHLAAAWRSVGSFHPDEFFQTIEFAAHKLGYVSAETLQYEFAERARSWLQPTIYAGAMGFVKSLGVINVDTLYRSCRTLSALLGLTAVLTAYRLSGCRRPIFLWGLMLFPLFPMFHARTSSENLSSLALLVGTVLIQSKTQLSVERARYLGVIVLAAISFGLAFEFRYQSSVYILGIGFWTLCHVKLSVPQWLGVFAAFFAIVGISSGVDAWGYGEWVFAPYRYIDLCIIRGKAAEFGTLPPWGFATLLASQCGAVGAALVGIIAGACLYYRRRDAVTWGTVPFVIVHCAIAHKELRFLYPLLDVISFYAIDQMTSPRVMRALSALRFSRPRMSKLLCSLAMLALTYFHGRWTFRRVDHAAVIAEALAAENRVPALVLYNLSPNFIARVPISHFLLGRLEPRETAVERLPSAIQEAQIKDPLLPTWVYLEVDRNTLDHLPLPEFCRRVVDNDLTFELPILAWLGETAAFGVRMAKLRYAHAAKALFRCQTPS